MGKLQTRQDSCSICLQEHEVHLQEERGSGRSESPKALIMSLFENEDVKKVIRASVSVAEVIEIVLPDKDIVTQALSTPYVGPKMQVNMAAALMCSLSLPIPRKGED
eukprot:7240422-Ditylum_brightwellii.AAC.1